MNMYNKISMSLRAKRSNLSNIQKSVRLLRRINAPRNDAKGIK